MNNRVFRLLTMSILFIGSLQSCMQMPVRDWPAMDGVVLDASTNQPIEGAYVVAHWIGSGRYSHTQCFYNDIALTNAAGQYTIPAWKNTGATARALRDQFVTIKSVYKPGYRLVNTGYEIKPYQKGNYYLEKDISSPSERLSYLGHQKWHCLNAGKNQRKLLPVFIERLNEANMIAKTDEDKKILNFIRHITASTATAEDGSMTSHEANMIIENYILENLQ